jgi:hypothetical protein
MSTTDQTSDPITQVPAQRRPRCLRCGKPVDSAAIRPKPGNHDYVVVEYECHGERATQEVGADVLQRDEGLAAWTAFNDYTSGLMPGKGAG